MFITLYFFVLMVVFIFVYVPMQYNRCKCNSSAVVGFPLSMEKVCLEIEVSMSGSFASFTLLKTVLVMI